MKWIEVKMQELGVTSNPNYKIAFFMDYGAMITVHTPDYGIVDVSRVCFELAVLVSKTDGISLYCCAALKKTKL